MQSYEWVGGNWSTDNWSTDNWSTEQLVNWVNWSTDNWSTPDWPTEQKNLKTKVFTVLAIQISSHIQAHSFQNVKV